MSVFIKILFSQAKWAHNLWQGWSTIKNCKNIYSAWREQVSSESEYCRWEFCTSWFKKQTKKLLIKWHNLIVHNSIVFKTTLDPGMLASYNLKTFFFLFLSCPVAGYSVNSSRISAAVTDGNDVSIFSMHHCYSDDNNCNKCGIKRVDIQITLMW